MTSWPPSQRIAGGGHPPDRQAGIKPKDLRGHSDPMWNMAVNDLVARHLAWPDLEVEAKLKNIASQGLTQHVGEGRGPGRVKN